MEINHSPSNYAASIGSNFMLGVNTPGNLLWWNRALQFYSETHISDITDGTSNTILLERAHPRLYHRFQYVVGNWVSVGGGIPAGVPQSTYVGPITSSISLRSEPQPKAQPCTIRAVRRLIILAACYRSTNWVRPIGSIQTLMTARVVRQRTDGGYSLPAVSTQAGSMWRWPMFVHFASNTIDLTTWENLGARNDGNAVVVP